MWLRLIRFNSQYIFYFWQLSKIDTMTFSQSFRHFRALSRKNAINWRRTPLGSISEIIFPVILMAVLVYVRKITKPEFMTNLKIQALRHPLFQPAKPDGPDGKYTISIKNIVENSLEMNSFMKYNEYTNLKRNFTVSPNITRLITNETEQLVIDNYLPIVDPLGPYLFYPEQCYSSQDQVDNGKKYRSPLIGYIKKGNEVEKDIISQLQAIFALQANIGKGIQTLQEISTLNTLFPGLIDVTAFQGIGLLSLTGGLGELTSDGFNMSDFGFNATDDQASLAMQTNFGDKGFDWLGQFKFKAFDNQSEFDNYISQKGYGKDINKPGICFGFSITENEAKNKYELELQFNDQFIGKYKALPLQKNPSYNPTSIWPDADAYTKYSWNGFGYLQNWVANTLLKRKTGNKDACIMTMTVPMMLPRMRLDYFGQLIQQVFTFFVLVMYIPPLYRTVYRIVQEKESKVKETMRMMGLGDFAYWVSWYAYYTTVNFVITFLSWFFLNGFPKFLKLFWKPKDWQINPDVIVFRYTNDFLLWLSLFIFGQSLFGLILVIQSLFSQARAAAITTTCIYFGSSMFSILIQDPNSSPMKIFLCTLSPTAAMVKTYYVMGAFEGSTIGSNFNNMFQVVGGYSVGQGLRMMTFDSVCLFLFGMYLEKVLPKNFGVRQHPCYFFLPKTWKSWCKRKQKISRQSSNSNAIAPEDQGQSLQNFIEETLKFETQNMNPECYEQVNGETFTQEREEKMIRISNLHKTYQNGFKAVKGLNLKLFSNEIFVLLGHNGAGKTSTISMLTGLYYPTEGNAEIFGADLTEELDEIRSFMGVCPQHDVLFELLTPEEHLDIFYDFKGGDKALKKAEINKLLTDVGVADKRKSMACQLSGGNKRKLSVAIALCGGSKFVLLDEPSSGLDLSARREVWNMLRAHKRDKIILLTTHYMDEADILGDRIGIMCQGKMTCLGSSLFLKQKFGVGYYVAIEKKTTEPNHLALPYFERNLGPGVKKFTEVQSEMSITIPTKYAPLFKKFFIKLDKKIENLNIRSYGVQISTLEQVFLQIGHLEDPEEILRKTPQKLQAQQEKKLRRMNSMPVLINSNDDKQKQIELDFEVDEDLNKSESGGSFKNKFGGSSKGGTFDDILRNSRSNSEIKGFSSNHTPQKQPNQLVVFNEDQRPSIGGRDSMNRLDSEIEVTPDKKMFKSSTDSDKKIHQIEESDIEKQINTSDVGFNLEKSKVNKSFCYNLHAVLTKRANIYRRNRKAFLNETFLPSLLILLGILLSRVKHDKRSPSKILNPSLYPLKQKILMNRTPIDMRNSDVDPEILASNLPNGTDAWDVHFDDTKRTRFDNYEQFGWSVFDFGTKESATQPYMYASYDIFQASKLQQKYKFISYLNATSQDATALVPQFMYESILKTATDDPDFEFKIRSTGYPLTEIQGEIDQGTAAGTVTFFTAISFSIMITNIVSYLVNERITNLKHVQQLSGMQLSAYWIGNFIFDFAKMNVTIATSIILFQVFKQGFKSALIAYVLFPFGILPFSYCMSFMFTVDSAAQTFTMFLHFLVMLVIASMIFAFRFTKKLELLGDKLTWLMRMIPSYAISDAVYFDQAGQLLANFRNNIKKLKGTINPDPYYWKNNTFDFYSSGFHFFFWTFVLFLIESDVANRCIACLEKVNSVRFPKPNADLVFDDDVIAEVERVKLAKQGEFKIKVSDFRKVYLTGKGPCNRGKALLAVEKLSFGLSAGECFALLGVNGAGKSTTFKSLTYEVKPTSGSIEINGVDIQKNFSKVKQFIGYCPQTNPIFDQMSVEEHLYYYAKIKGIPKQNLKELVEEVIVQLDLQTHRSKEAGQLSGGNKRKLAVAMAIVGRPPIILLDEPSAGMDPEARRFMWSVVAKIASNKTSAVILTTHSMEEAEALSTKMGIMVKGGIFKCFGSAQHIRNKFGQGYIIEIKFNQPTKENLDVIQSDFDVDDSESSYDKFNNKKDKQGSRKEMVNLMGVHQKLKEKKTPKFVMDAVLREPGDSTSETGSLQSLIQDRRHLELTQQIGQNQVQSDQETPQTKSAASFAKSDHQSDIDLNIQPQMQQHNEFVVDANEIAQKIYIQTQMYTLMKDLCNDFEEVELLEKYGSYVKIRVSKKEHSLGALFGIIEDLKNKFPISDYSVSQTTLEQIFQSFANLNFDEKIQKYVIDAISGELVKLERDSSEVVKDDILFSNGKDETTPNGPAKI